jgi:hypothetical protein
MCRFIPPDDIAPRRIKNVKKKKLDYSKVDEFQAGFLTGYIKAHEEIVDLLNNVCDECLKCQNEK